MASPLPVQPEKISQEVIEPIEPSTDLLDMDKAAELLKKATISDGDGPPLSDKPIATKEEKFLVQCSECQDIFTPRDFRVHVCQVESTEDNISIATAAAVHPLANHPCVAMMRENSMRMRKFIKDELKINLAPIYPAKASLPSNSTTTECHICFRILSSRSALAKHLTKHDGQLEAKDPTKTEPLLDFDVCFACLICGRAFATVDQCEEHVYRSDSHQLAEGEEDEAKVNQEGEGYAEDKGNTEEETQQLKMDAVVLKFVFQCEYCDYIFARKEDLLKHEATHDPKLGYLCTSCEINSTCTKDMQQHWQLHCPFTLALGSVLNGEGGGGGIKSERTRIRLTHDFVCNVCFETFPSLDILYEHRHKENHYFPRYSQLDEKLLLGCEVCGEMFDSCVKYCEHFEENHTKKSKAGGGGGGGGAAGLARNRQYLCDVCGKTYTQSSHLWQHLRFHQGVKPFQCSVEGCERRFTIRPDLNDHIRKFHTHERPYQCLVCGKRFLTGSVFYQHRLIHRGERRYECETCGKKFFRADALKNHNRIHSGEKPFQCLVCLKKFRQRGDCQKHMEARHMKQ